MKNVRVVGHPLVRQKLSRLRDEHTGGDPFRRLLADVAGWLFYEAAHDLELRRHRVATPMESTWGAALKRRVLLVPVLRAGLGMLNGILPLLPGAEVGFIGLRRNEISLEAESYYRNLPRSLSTYDIFLLDPMLATGGSTLAAIEALRKHRGKRIRLVCLVSAPEGIRNVHDHHPNLIITTASVDRCLNQNGFILPGLGDAGDRLFGA